MSEREQPAFELRCWASDNTLLRVGPMRCQAEAIGLAWHYLGDGRAVRAEVDQNVRGDLRLLSVLGQPHPRPPTLPGDSDAC